jgi:hypothetical protein
MKKPDKCRHYNGTVNDACDAGVKYADVQLGHGTPKYSLPCYSAGDNGRGRDWNTLGAACEKCSFPTAEEVAADEAEIKVRFEGMIKARDAIVANLGGPWKKKMPGSAGVIGCPVCGKPDSLRFTRSGYNGHIHAKCSTEKCVSWME